MEKILALPLKDNDAGAATIGEYLCALLKTVWTEAEGFNGKRPFGNSGWQTSIERALVLAGAVEGKFDEDGYLDEVDSRAVNKIILDCIREAFEEKRTVEKNTIIQQPTTANLSDHRGGMFIASSLLSEIAPEITLDGCDTIGHYRDTGVFDTLRQRLLLPEHYTIVGIFQQNFGREWAILIESPDLPDVSGFTWEYIEYPRIEPVYCHTFDAITGQREAHLVEIKVHAQRTVPIKGGLDWLMKAQVGDLAKEKHAS